MALTAAITPLMQTGEPLRPSLAMALIRSRPQAALVVQMQANRPTLDHQPMECPPSMDQVAPQVSTGTLSPQTVAVTHQPRLTVLAVDQQVVTGQVCLTAQVVQVYPVVSLHAGQARLQWPAALYSESLLGPRVVALVGMLLVAMEQGVMYK